MSDVIRTLKFNGAGLDLVVNALAALPYRDVAALIADMQAQLQTQAKPAKAPKR